MDRIAKTLASAALLAALALELPAGAAAPGDAAAPPRERTRVLVLGTPHLAELGTPLAAASLAPLIARLVVFHPDIIAVEAMPGESCDLAARHPATYPPDEIGHYCVATGAAAAATGLDEPAALAQMKRLLAGWPGTPSAAQRRHLAAIALAAGEPETARLQWRQLPPAERREGDGLSAALVAELDRPPTGEIELVALPVAAALGLQRLDAVDDHSGDNIQVTDAAGFGRAIQAAWDTAEATVRPLRQREAELARRQDVMGLYRAMNDPAVQRTKTEADFGAASRDRSREGFGQMYVAGWETRNLRIAANVSAAFRERPGARVLVIIGASHKPWLDRLLGQMSGVEIEDAERMLR